MRVVAGSLLWLVCVAGAYPAQVVRQVTWSELQEAGALLAGHVEPDGWLRVESAGGEAGRIALVRIEEPGLTGIRYALSGSVRYRRVGRGSYLEMWST
ncbi:MAG TPA: hypothetical protein EYP56_04930, partial [Planctomycetaceae bacterium]|nr:hypothetical protein [Planctomycetaceae bacterium]